jgi:hypothetical protein
MEKTAGYRTGSDARIREQKAQRVKTCHPDKSCRPGAGVFAIKNIRIDAGSSSVG